MDENKVIIDDSAEKETVEDVVVAEANEPVETSSNSSKPSFGKRLLANIKERIRKSLVTLKRNPQRIPFVCFAIVSIIWLFWLFTFSRAAYQHSTIEFIGLTVFVNTLLSILILALFFNAFPKRKKPNIVMIVLLFVFVGIMIAMDIIFYQKVYQFVYVDGGVDAEGLASEPFVPQSLSYAIAHIVLISICAVVLALYPVYKRLLPKINTKKVVEGNDINEEIDVEDE